MGSTDKQQYEACCAAAAYQGNPPPPPLPTPPPLPPAQPIELGRRDSDEATITENLPLLPNSPTLRTAPLSRCVLALI